MQAAVEQPAVGRALLEFASGRVGEGQRELAQVIKLKLSASGHLGAELLDYAEDDPFLVPEFFAFFGESDPAATLDQIIYGVLPVEKRPAEIEAYADRRGVVDLPGLGQLVSDVRDRIVTAAPGDLAICAGEAGCDAIFVEEARISGTSIRYATRPQSLFEPICRKACHGSSPSAADEATDDSGSITRALKIIRAVDAEFYRCLLAVTREIVKFSAEEGESFATIGAHGAVFLRTPLHCDEVYFIEDLAHQCGHLLFNAITLDRSELIEIDPNTPLGDLIGDPSEVRTLYVTLHGVFTECLMSIVLAGSLGTDFFNDRQRHELKGRLSLIMKRLQLDLGLIRELEVFTPAGRNLLESFGEVFDQVFQSAKSDIIACDLRNQPYSFCYDRFIELNG